MRNGKRAIRAIGTKNNRIAQKLRTALEYEMLKEIHFPQKKKNIAFPELDKIYLKSNPHWSKATFKINSQRLAYYINKGLPKNPTSRAMSIQRVNNCLNWAEKNGYSTNQMKINGDMKGESRLRVLNKDELYILLKNIRPQEFKKFVSFAYYTGARRGEIAHTSSDMVKDNSLIVSGQIFKYLQDNLLLDCDTAILKSNKVWKKS
jgi:integrase